MVVPVGTPGVRGLIEIIDKLDLRYYSAVSSSVNLNSNSIPILRSLPVKYRRESELRSEIFAIPQNKHKFLRLYCHLPGLGEIYLHSPIPVPVTYTSKPEARSLVTSDSRMLQDVFLSILVTITTVLGVLVTPTIVLGVLITPLLAPTLATLKQQLRNLRQVSHCKTFSREIV